MHGDRPLRLATRRSAQAQTQAQVVADALMSAHPGRIVELVLMDTMGDRPQYADVPLHAIGGQGVFAKDVQNAVLCGDADMAAHSAKDLPAVDAEGLQLGAFCKRRDPRDVLIGASLEGLPHGADVATGSVRRRAQLKRVRPDLQFRELRGNIHTRLGKVPPGGAIVMAAAALEILGLSDMISDFLAPETFVPSPGQGCVAIECRIDDDETLAMLATVDHGPSRRAVEVERAFLAELGAGCSLPVGAHAGDLVLTAFLAADDDSDHLIESIELPDDHTLALAHAAALARSMHDRLQ